MYSVLDVFGAAMLYKAVGIQCCKNDYLIEGGDPT